ncbi:MAG: S41 family peptidase [Roseiflexaceae bacterium]
MQRPTSHVLLFGALLFLIGCSEAFAPTQPPTNAPTPATSTAQPPTRASEQPVRPTEPIEPIEPIVVATVPVVTIEPPTEVPIMFSLEERRQLFEDVWQIVHENYLYPDFRGTDWVVLREEYAGRVEAATTRDQFYATMIELVGQLGDSHSRFVPPSDALVEELSTVGQVRTVGIGVLTRVRRESAFIQLVFPNSPADRAGIRPRDRIIAVDGRPYLPIDGDLQGEIGTSVRITVVRPGEKARDIVLQRQEVESRIVPTYRRFPGNIGYVSIPTLWVSDMGEQVSGALTDLVAGGQLEGIILDVRSNRGGWGDVLNEVLSHFVRGQVGGFSGRDRVRPLVIAPPAGPDLRRVPLVVLVDNDTASYAELLAAILQSEAGAIVVGSQTAGNTETIYAHSFADGSRLWLAEEGFRLRDGTNLEGVGVIPDVMIESDWTRYSEDDDPQLLEALRLLGGGPK